MRQGLLLLTSIMVIACCGCGFLGLGPHTSKFDKQVEREITKSCNSDAPCRIALKDVMDFDWDEVYVFRNGLTPIDVDKIFGKGAGFRGEFTRKILFLKNGSIVDRDENYPDLERMLPGELLFHVEGGGNPACQKYDQSSIFSVERLPARSAEYYQITCVSCTKSPAVADSP